MMSCESGRFREAPAHALQESFPELPLDRDAPPQMGFRGGLTISPQAVTASLATRQRRFRHSHSDFVVTGRE
ncbi:MAG: hypothetical protein PVSMB4_10430 [Ktedonobacterales bacterium]